MQKDYKTSWEINILAQFFLPKTSLPIILLIKKNPNFLKIKHNFQLVNSKIEILQR